MTKNKVIEEAGALKNNDIGAAGFSPHRFRKSLRNPAINYSNGWFFVTSQIARNKSILGAIAGDCCILNALGEKVRDCWLAIPSKYPEVALDEFVVMPNHFHAILRIERRAQNRSQHLGFIMSRFKGATGYMYGKMRDASLVQDIGEHLWQFDYWDDIITSEQELEAMRGYIRANPANWTRDRYGACTSYAVGNFALLDAPKIAFVASQGYFAADLKPRQVKRARSEAALAEAEAAKAARSDEARPDEARPDDSDIQPPVVISTFTSAQEREMLRRLLAKRRQVIMVAPQGIPDLAPKDKDIEEAGFSPPSPQGFSPPLIAAIRENRALVISPQPPNSPLNKKVATWCNEYVLRHADEIWAGSISPNGMLAALLNVCV